MIDKRWIVALVGVAGLALVTLNGTAPASLNLSGPAGAACDPNAKPANLAFTLKDINGASVNLASLKGKVILLDFWATWCGPCKIEIPGFIELHEKYKARGLAVVGVSVDDTVEQLKPFVAQYKMTYPVLVGLGQDAMVDGKQRQFQPIGDADLVVYVAEIVLDHLLGGAELLGDLLVAVEELGQLLAHPVHQVRPDLGVAELVLGLRFENRVLQPNGHRADHAFPDVVAVELLARVLVDGLELLGFAGKFGQRGCHRVGHFRARSPATSQKEQHNDA